MTYYNILKYRITYSVVHILLSPGLRFDIINILQLTDFHIELYSSFLVYLITVMMYEQTSI